MSTVFVDTSGWIALLSRDDRLHDRTLTRYDEIARPGDRLLTNNYVVDEPATFRQMLLDAVAARRLRIVWVSEKSEAEAWGILEQYADVKLSLIDATCAVTCRESRISEVFGCDRDFEALGFVVLPGPG